MTMSDDKKFFDSHAKAHKLAQDLIAEGINPYAVAGIFQAIATQMYRIMLDDEEFRSLMDTVINSTDTGTEKVYH